MKEKNESAYPLIQLLYDIYGDNSYTKYAGLTLFQKAAIELKVPIAEEEWLNKMIMRSRRMDCIQAAMSNMTEYLNNKHSFGEYGDVEFERLANRIIKIVDACIKAEEKTQKNG